MLADLMEKYLDHNVCVIVLILVLLEYARRHSLTKHDLNKKDLVLILVLLEYARRHTTKCLSYD